MAEGDFRSLLKRGSERHRTPSTPILQDSRRELSAEVSAPDSSDTLALRRGEVNMRSIPDLRTKPYQAPSSLDDIAALLQSLTYGEMIALSEAIWNSRSEEPVTEKTLPPVLHRWSATHLAAAQSS